LLASAWEITVANATVSDGEDEVVEERVVEVELLEEDGVDDVDVEDDEDGKDVKEINDGEDAEDVNACCCLK
jgi:hypothetical protein